MSGVGTGWKEVIAADEAARHADAARAMAEMHRRKDERFGAGRALHRKPGTFDPWQVLTAHRPLGEVLRARKVAYFASQQTRGAV